MALFHLAFAWLTQQIADDRLCKTMSTNELTVSYIQHTAAHMVKCQLNMGADLLLAKDECRE